MDRPSPEMPPWPGACGTTINCSGTSVHWPGAVCTANSSPPFPVRPSVFVTTMSKLPICAVLETVMLAVRVVEFTKAVEFTVTPPGLLVPLTNHCALAPALKPLPPTVTLRLVVPWTAEFGIALFTDICAPAGLASRASVTIRNISITAGRMVARCTFIFLTPFASRAGPFALVTRTRLTVFRQSRRNQLLTVTYHHESGPIVWMPVHAISMQHRP